MLNIGISEILLIAALLLVVVGPERLPKMLRMAGRQYAKLRRAANELQNAFMDEGDLLDVDLGGLDATSPPGLAVKKSEPSPSTPDEQSEPAEPAGEPSTSKARLRDAQRSKAAESQQQTEKAEPVEPDESVPTNPLDSSDPVEDEARGES